MKPEEKHTIKITKNGKKTAIKPDRISYIIEEVGQWRKANQIHNWFVENVQEGNDDCKTYYVSRKDLQELLNLVNQALKQPSAANSLLPTAKGFFFGGTEYDAYYFQDLTHTKAILETILAEPDTGDFEYQSSW